MSIFDKVTITKVATLNGSPAKIRIYPNDTAQMFLAQDICEGQPKEIVLFIMLHELGHFVLKSSDEEAVDRWAFRQYAKTGNSLEKAFKAVSGILHVSNPAHADRIKRQFYRAKHKAFLRRGNLKKFLKQKI